MRPAPRATAARRWRRGAGRACGAASALAVVALLTACGEEAPAPDPPASPRAEREARDAELALDYFSDTPLVDQDGRPLRFFSDVLKDHVVVIQGFCTRCEGHTPRQSQVLLQLQAMLGESLGQDVFIVSVTVDPETDTPDVLREYAQELGAGEGWIFLTGEPKDVAKVNRRLGQAVEEPEDLDGLYKLGNVRTTLWMKLPAHAMPMDLYRHVQRLLQDTGEEAEG